MLNDVVSITLYRAIVRPYGSDSLTWAPVAEFLMSLFGSIILGVALGLVLAYLLKRQFFLGKRTENVEAAVMLMCPWITYILADVPPQSNS